ncbi:hypothetical protein N7495_005223 [Penicillium taxi]|uniref:uncharacterized protein n=1 Tax=Penicillium taxi TaxID=168475 RepID=UPI0025453A64|nr:uncharacterized protein N7495_005223 [Penicillium taxi]KAJ5893532.1 hypothetical protein N7495_005223 [Penicillium taxi]
MPIPPWIDPTKPISVKLFSQRLHQAWLGTRGITVPGKNNEDSLLQLLSTSVTSLDNAQADGSSPTLPRRIGIAVSGGADSMALAYLCGQLEHQNLNTRRQKLTPRASISVTAFVVDHKARRESSEEAKTVAGWLSKMGITTQILELDWSSLSKTENPSAELNGEISMPSAFETHARRLRYRALGKACRERGIEALLLGHHQDDSVETAIWRLSSGAGLFGLSGIQKNSRIPECHGLFGISESGSSETVWTKQATVQPAFIREKSISRPKPASSQADKPTDHILTDIVQALSKNRPDSRMHYTPENLEYGQNGAAGANDNVLNLTDKDMSSLPTSIARGGVFLCRPLLCFPKTRLIETCHRHDVPYVSDPTNFDPTLTPRNAIRSLLASNSLPRALQAPRIISLISSSQDLLEDTKTLTDAVLAQCQIKQLYLRTGTMTIQFPRIPSLESLSPTRTRQIQAMALRHVTEILSPFPGSHFPLRSFEPFVSQIFGPEENNKAFPKSKPFTLGGVMFQPIDWKSSAQGEPITWQLSRQPFMKGRSPVMRIEVPIPPATRPTFSEWSLWDDRFWFRLSIKPVQSEENQGVKFGYPIAMPFVIRPFEESDPQKTRGGPGMTVLARVSARNHARKLQSIFSREAPAASRFTVPVLEILQSGDENNGQLLALPTLNYHFLGDPTKNSDANEMQINYIGTMWSVRWQWMYKRIDTDTLRLMDGLVTFEAV